MDAPQRAFELLRHPGERQIQCRSPSDQHIIMPGTKPVFGQQPNNLPQSPADPITLDGISDLFRDRKAESCRACVTAVACLQHERCGRRLGPGRRGQKVRPLPQSFHESKARGGFGRRQADSRLRPRPRRADRTLRPPFVAMRARKP